MNKYYTFYFLKLIGCAMLCPGSLQADNLTHSLQEQWKTVRADKYQLPTAYNLNNSKKLFSKLFEHGLSVELITSFRELGLHLTEYKINAESLIIVNESQPPYQGAGLYIIRQNGNGIMLQAPHGYSDLHTGKLVLKLMQEGRYSAVALNTIPRSYLLNNERQHADMAHMWSTYFMSFSDAFASQYPSGHIVQLHGFNSAKRLVTNDVSMILSAGVKSKNHHVQHQAACMRKLITSKVRIYPDEINVLGGTTNSIGRNLRKYGFSGFRHYEMNFDLRKKLINKKDLRNKFSNCIVNDA